jgi:hypothetical protein
LDQAAPQSAFRRGDTAQATFRSVEALAIGDLAVPGDGGAMTSAFTGPRHLARLLRDVAEGLMGSSLAVLPVPAGANAEVWRTWIRNRARSKPTIWPNHRPAIDDGLLDAGRSAVLVLPTGAGKTTVSELKIAATLAAGRKVIFLVPTLALVESSVKNVKVRLASRVLRRRRYRRSQGCHTEPAKTLQIRAPVEPRPAA